MRATRYHSGGLVGLKPNEVPVILTPGRSYIGLGVHPSFEMAARPLGKHVSLTLSCDTSRAEAEFRKAARLLWRLTVAEFETRRMEQRVRDLYEARL